MRLLVLLRSLGKSVACLMTYLRTLKYCMNAFSGSERRFILSTMGSPLSVSLRQPDLETTAKDLTDVRPEEVPQWILSQDII